VIGDGRGVPEGQELATDVCVIGAGAAGITIADALTGSSLGVVLLESGGLDFDVETNGLNAGANVGLPYFPLDGSRLRYFGGSTNHWGGYCRPLEPVDFEDRPWIPLSRWPIDRADLDPYYPAARPIVGLTEPNGDPAPLIAADRSRPLFETPARLVDVLAEIVPSRRRSFGERFREELLAAPDVQVLLNASAVEIETDPGARHVERVHVATLAGNRFSVRARAVVLATGGIENARLLLASDRVQPGGVGNDRDVVGRYFLEHPRFIAGGFIPSRGDLRTRFYEPHDVTGREVIGYLSLAESVMREEQLVEVQVRLRPTYDPAVEAALVGEDVAALRDLVREPAGVVANDRFGRHVARVLADLTTWQDATIPGGPLAAPLPEVIAEIVRRGAAGELSSLVPLLFGDLATVGYQELAGGLPIQAAELTTRIDPVPNPDSRIRLGTDRDALGMRRAELHWALSPLDKWSAIRTLEILGAEVGRAGMGRVQITLDDDDDSWPDDLAGGWHHMGTTRMSDDPASGVVDRDGRVHGLDDLYVAGSSVFPTGGSGTPTMTIVALALRLADHLRTQLT
jgi:choline dehydrogenase-like flavoprotein